MITLMPIDAHVHFFTSKLLGDGAGRVLGLLKTVPATRPFARLLEESLPPSTQAAMDSLEIATETVGKEKPFEGKTALVLGSGGVGKTTTARLLAKALNCEKGPTPTPCNECGPCVDITAGVDVDVQEIDLLDRVAIE